jgi:hypothetical protein
MAEHAALAYAQAMPIGSRERHVAIDVYRTTQMAVGQIA